MSLEAISDSVDEQPPVSSYESKNDTKLKSSFIGCIQSHPKYLRMILIALLSAMMFTPMVGITHNLPITFYFSLGLMIGNMVAYIVSDSCKDQEGCEISQQCTQCRLIAGPTLLLSIFVVDIVVLGFIRNEIRIAICSVLLLFIFIFSFLLINTERKRSAKSITNDTVGSNIEYRNM